MIKAYVDFWKRYVDFEGKTNVPGYWYVILCNFIIGLVLGIIITLALNFLAYLYLVYLYYFAAFIPSLAILIRRLRDAGKDWTNIFWIFLPIVGWIILIVYLCKQSVAE